MTKPPGNPEVADRWKYGDAGDRIPVPLRSIWRVGPRPDGSGPTHTLACGNLEHDQHTALLNYVDQTPRMVYADPPWNSGNVRHFYTKAGMDRGKVDFTEFLEALLLPLVERGIPDIYLEGGVAQQALCLDVFRSFGLTASGVWTITYYQKKPCLLYHLRPASADPTDNPDHGLAGDTATGMDDDDTPAWAISRSSNPGDVVMDTCIGRGLTATTCTDLDRVCIGTELNPRRLAYTIDDLNQRYGLPYEQIGELPAL